MAPPGSNKRMGAKAGFMPRFCHHDTRGPPSIFLAQKTGTIADFPIRYRGGAYSLAILPSPNDPERDPLTFLQIGLLHVIVRRLAPASRPSSTRPPQPRRQRPRAALPDRALVVRVPPPLAPVPHRLRPDPELLAVRYAPIRQEIEQSEDIYAPGYTPPEACGALKCGRTGSLNSFDSRS